MLEVERAAELLFMGAFNKYSTTAFVTFNSRVTESIAQQMLLSHQTMEIQHAPNPHDVIWENVAIPKSQVTLDLLIHLSFVDACTIVADCHAQFYN
jgi:hypothetical protein